MFITGAYPGVWTFPEKIWTAAKARRGGSLCYAHGSLQIGIFKGCSEIFFVEKMQKNNENLTNENAFLDFF